MRALQQKQTVTQSEPLSSPQFPLLLWSAAQRWEKSFFSCVTPAELFTPLQKWGGVTRKVSHEQRMAACVEASRLDLKEGTGSSTNLLISSKGTFRNKQTGVSSHTGGTICFTRSSHRWREQVLQHITCEEKSILRLQASQMQLL